MSLAGAALGADEKPKPPAEIEYGVSFLVGYGAGAQFEDDARNRYGYAAGLRAGLTLARPRLHFGLSGLHFAGYDAAESRVYTNTFDVELGYDFRLLREHLLIRPQLALGAAQSVTIQSDNAGYPLGFHCAPGLVVGARIAPVLLTAEYRYDMVLESWPNANSVLLGIGLVI